MRNREPQQPPRAAEWLLRRLFPDGGAHTSVGDFAEVYAHTARTRGALRAGLWYGAQIVLGLKALILGNIYWSCVMLLNTLKIAFRNYRRQKGYTFINMFGLTAGIASCLVIFVFVRHEMSYDSFRPDLDRIYRVAVGSPDQGSATISGPVARVLKDYFPEVESVARILRLPPGLVARGEVRFFEDRRMYADDELFEILGIPFVEGDPEVSLDSPDAVVISESVARRYFGDRPALGETLTFNETDLEVTGVAADAPPHSHFKYDCFLPMVQIKDRYPFDRWFLANLHVYIKVGPGIDLASFSQRVERIAQDYAAKEGEELEGDETYFLQPVAGIHLHSHLRSEFEPGFAPLYLYVFSAVGTLILLIACFNFINLSTSRALKRAREVGVRKVIGARREQLVLQFAGESLVIILAALGLALLLVWEMLPFVNAVTGRAFTAQSLFQPGVFVFLLLLALLVGFAASAYPAVSLSSFHPGRVLRHDLHGLNRGSRLRRMLVVSQFAVSIILIAGTLLVYRQIDFMKQKNLGYDLQQKLVLPIKRPLSIEENYETVKTAFLRNAAVAGASVTSNAPGQQLGRWYTDLVGEGEERGEVLNYFYADPDFLKEFKLRLAAGRFFQPDMPTDVDQAFLLNRAAVLLFGWSSPEEALGKKLKCMFEGQVIGVVEDYHYRGLRTAIEPLAIVWRPEMFDHVILTLDTSDLTASLSAVQGTWEELFAGIPSEYYFLDDAFNLQYVSEERMARMLTAFALLAILIACLGLLGLASFTAEQKTKEIGIRKVMGATMPEIMILLSREFARWIILANVIAWPLTYLAVKQWLQNFAYRAPIHPGVFVLSAAAALGIALVTISYQSVKAAASDPVQALKYE
jgi:putative ABC transport system permease protein